MSAAFSPWPGVPSWSQQVFAARNANEARLFVQCQGGSQVESRAVDTELHILADHPEGQRVHRFTLGGGAPWEPTNFGDGPSGILDPAELLFFADRVVRELPGPDAPIHPQAVIRRLRLAAAALREAVKLIPPDGVEGARFFTAAAQTYAQANPDRFSVIELQSYADAIDADADELATPLMDIVETLKGFRENTIGQDFFLRSVLRHPRWHIPVDDCDHPLLWTLGGSGGDAGGFVAAQSSPTSPDGSPAYWIEVDGRHLIRNLPADCAGVVFELGTSAACVIELDGSAETLRYWLSVLDVEDALLNPAPGQTHLLLSHEWFLLGTAAGEPLIDEENSFRVVHLFAAPDRLRDFVASRPAYRQSALAAIAGRPLFTALSGRSDYDAVHLHYGFKATEVLDPDGAALFANGIDGRSQARVLTARTTAEIHLFLDLEGASREGRTHQLEYLDDDLVARYTGTVAGSQRSWRFQLVAPSEDPLDLGPGPSQILCAGQLADLVRRRLRVLSTDPGLDAEDRLTAAGAARWARELEKMLIGDTIPRSAVHTPDGSRYLREIPEMATGHWIRDARRRAERLQG